MIYIEGYALNCALGTTTKEAFNAMIKERTIPSTLDDGNRYYRILNRQEDDYYSIMESVAKEAIEQAELSQDEVTNMALFIATSSPKLPLNEKALEEQGEMMANIHVPQITEVLSKALGMENFSTVISTACSSSANALVQAKEMIEAGLIERALVLGVELYNQLTIKGFDSFLLLSQESIKPFDKERNGTILGEGLSAIVLGKKETPLEFVAGSVMLDINSITSPNKESLVKIMEDVCNKANIEPREIELIKAHATATLHNDAVEADAINALFQTPPPVISLKPYMGHTMGACGSNELALLAEALKEGVIPKTPNFNNPEEEHPLKPLTETIEAKKGYYLLNHLGFGGNNCCLLLNYKGQ